MASKPQEIDAARILEVIGGWTVGSHAAVARAFGVSANTVKQSWAPVGMPGRPGSYKIGEIFVWRVTYERQVVSRQKSRGEAGSVDARQAEADARKTELEVEILETKMAESAGRLIDREVVGSSIRVILAELTEESTTIGDELETEFSVFCDKCQASAKDKTGIINRMFGRILVRAGERLGRVIPKKRDDVDL